MTIGTMLEVLDMLLNEAKRDKVTFYGTTAIEYLGNKTDYTGKRQREVYRIERLKE